MERFRGRNLQFKKGEPVARQSLEGALQPFPLPYSSEDMKRFHAGEGSQELVVVRDGRTEFSYRHRQGFAQRDIRVALVGAHPDDHALTSGLEYVMLQQSRKNATDMGLAVVTATAGQDGKENPHSETGDLGIDRIYEEVKSTRRLGADRYDNFGFVDGNTRNDASAITRRIIDSLYELQPHIVITTAPDDPVHVDHLVLADATANALRQTDQNPILLYADSQAGFQLPAEGQGRSVGFHIEEDEHDVITGAFFDHWSQTSTMTPDIKAVLGRGHVRAQQLGRSGLAGIGRQDMSFSSQPIEEFLGERSIFVPNQQEVEHVIFERV